MDRTSRGTPIVISTHGYGVAEGFAAQITLPDGKLFYTGVGSLNHYLAKERGWATKIVNYYGACIYCNINDRAHRGFPIQIDGISVANFIAKIATEQETRNIHF